MSVALERRKLKEQFDHPKSPREKATVTNGRPNGLPCASCGTWTPIDGELEVLDRDHLCGACTEKADNGVIVYVDGEWKPAELPSLAEEFRQLPTLANRRKSSDQVLSTTTPAGIREHDPEALHPGGVLDSEGLKKLPEEWGITIDPEFRDLLDPLEPIELQKLRSDIIVRGCIDPLIVWRCTGPIEGLHAPRRILLDGHHRYQLCWEHRKPVAIKELEFASRAEAFAWMRDHQVGRRNVTPEKKRELLARDYAAELERRKNGRKDTGADKPAQKNGKAAAVVAEKHGVSPATVKRAVESQKATEKIAKVTGRTAAELAHLSRQAKTAIAALPPEKIKQAFAGGRNAVRTAARHEVISKKAQKKAKRPRKETDLRFEAERMISRYLDTFADAAEAWKQSDYLLDAINQWRGRNKQPATARKKRKPR